VAPNGFGGAERLGTASRRLQTVMSGLGVRTTGFQTSPGGFGWCWITSRRLWVTGWLRMLWVTPNGIRKISGRRWAVPESWRSGRLLIGPHYREAPRSFMIYTVSQKNIPDVFRYNSRKHSRIFIIFGRNISKKASNRKMLYFSTSYLINASALL